MCCHHIKSEPRTQTFMLYAHPSPLCPSQWPKLPSHWRSTSPKTREAKMIFFANFVRFEKQPFPIFACSKSCNSVITHPSARPPKMFRKHVVLLEIPYPRMCFFWWRTSARVWIKRNDGPPQVILRPHETLDSSGSYYYYLENSYTHIHIYTYIRLQKTCHYCDNYCSSFCTRTVTYGTGW